MHGHLQQKLDSIAVMKCIGARSAQVIRIYTAQTLMLGLAGGVLGAVLGVAVASAFPGLIAKYFTIDAAASWDPWPALQGIAIACVVTLLFTLPPLLRDPRHPAGAGFPPRRGGAARSRRALRRSLMRWHRLRARRWSPPL